ncbi:MAG: hypothetical protein U9Q38_08650, partial [Thermodesulfobacteriota bacterium]|nr:hypothetical protein [Thermodesulfobacteriota bacterium]
MNRNGLAGQGPMMNGQGQGQQMVKEVVNMLLQGANPEELIAQGVPAEVVEMAMQQVQQIVAQQQQEQ